MFMKSKHSCWQSQILAEQAKWQSGLRSEQQECKLEGSFLRKRCTDDLLIP